VQGEKDSLVNNVNNHMRPAPVPAVLPSVGRREPERSEGDRSATDGKTGAAPKPRPDPEVVAQAKRRRFAAEYKQRILTEADRAKGSGGVGALLRREGLYSSLLTNWRRERDAIVLQALAPQKRGPKSKRDPVAEENQQLRRETLQLKEALRKAEIVIDIQKKVAALLGRPILPVDPEEKA
jgi:transposase